MLVLKIAAFWRYPLHFMLNQETVVSLSGNLIKNTEKYKYLGFNVTKNGVMGIKTNKLFKGPGLWKTVGVPALIHGEWRCGYPTD